MTKKKTIPQKIIEFIQKFNKKHPQSLANSYGIKDALKREKRSSVSSALSRMFKDGRLVRPTVDPQQYDIPVPKVQWYYHYVSVLVYCQDKQHQVYALSFKDDDTNIFNELQAAIIDTFGDSCGNTGTGYLEIDDAGYSHEPTDDLSGKNSGNTYPQIEVGQL